MNEQGWPLWTWLSLAGAASVTYGRRRHEYGSLSGGLAQAFQNGLIYLIAVTLAIAGLVQLLPRTTVNA
ncbi:MAG TPA: hypothetical protein VFT31_01235 [Kribbella sp.]|nr:hypothetical protein [Kribbella sp.]